MSIPPLPENVDARIASAATPGFPVVTRARLRQAGVDRTRVRERCADARMTVAWNDTLLIGAHDMGSIPRDLLRRAAVATVEPNAALGGVSAIERLAGWDRFAGEILVVSDRGHANIPEYRISFRRVDAERDLAEVRELGGVPTASPMNALLHGVRDLNPYQAANALCALRYRCGISVDDVRRELGERKRVVGAPRMRFALDLVESGSAGTKSRSEDVLLPDVELRYGTPLVNVRGSAGIVDYEPDFVWPRMGWIIEVDGRHHLEDEAVRAADLARDELLRLDGWIVVRIPWWWMWHRRAHALRVIDLAFYP